jgi:hypothetical protein
VAFAGADIPFVGGAYTAPMLLQDAEELINFYCEISASKNAKEVIALLGCPGLNPVASSQAGPVRGCWVLPGGNQALFATGNLLYLMTITVPATQTSIPQFAVTQVGTLLTNNGPVVFRDNGVLFNGLGGYCLLVDGQYCYYYLLQGTPYSFSFTAGATNASATLSLPGTLPNGLIISLQATLSDTAGVIPANTTIASVDVNTPAITMSNAATGNSASDTVTLTVQVFGRITDPGFLGADRIVFTEGWLGFNDPNTRTFYTTGPTPYQVLFPGSFFSLKDSSTDNLVTMMEMNREWWLIGERTGEVWYNGGGQSFAWSRLPGVGPQIGCAAKHSIVRGGQRLGWLGKNEQGQNMFVATEGYSWVRISTHAIEYAISQYPVVSDCIGYAYEDQGHLFLVWTFPTADVTWVYDATVAAQDPGAAWHKRLSYDPVAGVYHRHRSNCFMDFGNVRLVGDYQTGQIHQMSRNYYTDAGAPLRCLRRTPPIWKKADRERVFASQLQIEFTPGVGLQSGQGSNPQALLRWSDDGGFTWSNEEWSGIGLVGDMRNRAIWRLLQVARDKVFELVFVDPVPRDIIGSTLFVEGSS